jgi:hypothetical protein
VASARREPTPEEQRAEFARDYERRNGGMAGRHDPNAPRKGPKLPDPPKPGSQRGTVLQAARSFGRPFSLTELILAAWRLDPVSFGLAGVHLVYPDSRPVLVTLCGKRGLVARGLIRRLRQNHYEAPLAGGAHD